MGRKEWLTPADAAKEMSRIAGYQITVADIKQMRRRGKLRDVNKIGKQITLYSKEEILKAKPVKKRNPRPVEEEASVI